MKDTYQMIEDSSNDIETKTENKDEMVESIIETQGTSFLIRKLNSSSILNQNCITMDDYIHFSARLLVLGKH